MRATGRVTDWPQAAAAGAWSQDSVAMRALPPAAVRGLRFSRGVRRGSDLPLAQSSPETTPGQD